MQFIRAYQYFYGCCSNNFTPARKRAHRDGPNSNSKIQLILCMYPAHCHLDAIPGEPRSTDPRGAHNHIHSDWRKTSTLHQRAHLSRQDLHGGQLHEHRKSPCPASSLTKLRLKLNPLLHLMLSNERKMNYLPLLSLELVALARELAFSGHYEKAEQSTRMTILESDGLLARSNLYRTNLYSAHLSVELLLD